MNVTNATQWISSRIARARRGRELRRIAALPSRVAGVTSITGQLIRFIDGPSFTSGYRAIFEGHIYRFVSSAQSPAIIDCGANIGLAIVYWKALFPDCKVVAFEPDESAFVALQSNVMGYGDVELIRAAVWTSDGEKDFLPDGADAGRLQDGRGEAERIVRTVRLRDHLTDRVDLLKLDIEGAEVAVLEDCADRLEDVQNLFVEYHGFVDRPQDLDVVLKILSDRGFRWHIQPEYVSPTPLLATPVDRGMDQRLNIFAFRRLQS